MVGTLLGQQSLLTLHSSFLLIVTAIIASPASSLPCPVSRPGAACGCSSYSVMAPLDKPSRRRLAHDSQRYPQEATDEDTDYMYVDDMAFRKHHQQDQLASDPASEPAQQLNPDFWPGGIIFYLIDDAFSKDYKSQIQAAMAEIESRVGSSHLEFRDALTKNGQICRKGYLYVVKTEREQCIAEVGMQRSGLTHVWLNQRVCNPGTIQHELLHSLGRYHEHCRPDRDSFVTLIPGSMLASECSNYMKFTTPFPDPALSLQYDTLSIMHYGSCYFTCNGSYTMVRKDGSAIVANREAMTSWDVAKMRAMYPTDAKVPFSDKFCRQVGRTASASRLSVVTLTAVLSLAVTCLSYC